MFSDRQWVLIFTIWILYLNFYFLGSFPFFLIYWFILHLVCSFPSFLSSHSLLTPPLCLSLPPIYFSSVSVQKGAELLWVSTKHVILNCSKTKDLSLRASQPSMKDRIQESVKALETGLFPLLGRPQVAYTTQLSHVCRRYTLAHRYPSC